MEAILSSITNWGSVPRKKSYAIIKDLDVSATAALELVRMAYLSGGWNSAYAMARFIFRTKGIKVQFSELHHGLQSRKALSEKEEAEKDRYTFHYCNVLVTTQKNGRLFCFNKVRSQRIYIAG